MKITQRIQNALAAFNKTNNGGTDSNAFLKYGNRRMPSTWTTPQISDQDFYTDLGFAVVNKRANRSVVIGKKFLYTGAKDSVVKRANEKGDKIIHPYISLIRDSIDFSERDFWYDISTYLDLEGVYYLMAVRTIGANGVVGNIQKFSLLNPYNVRAVKDSKGNLGGYVEQRGGMQRQIPKEMIIPIRLLNPFDPEQSYSLADAARNSQFTLKQANDFAREAINGNLNAPGIISSAIELPDDQFDNFVERIKHHGRGEPLFGNGAGTVTWVDMQADLDKAALDKINSINRDTLIAVSGLSVTGLGMEQTGTGREVSRSQKDDFTENAIMPQIENIIDALNLDYRRYYNSQYKNNGYVISLDNPLEANYDAIQAEVDIRDSRFTLTQSLVNAGYTYEIASKYANGDLNVTDLGEPTEVEKPTEIIEVEDDEDNTGDSVETSSYIDKAFDVYEGYPIPVVQYLTDQADQIKALSEQGSVIYSNESLLQLNAAHKTVRITRIDELKNSLVAVVDDTTYIKLGEFNQNADRPAIIAKLNKRYKGQPVAIKKKIDLNHECNHALPEAIKNAAFDKQALMASSTNDLLTSAEAAEDRLYNWYLNEINSGDFNPHADLDNFIEGFILPFAVYFTVMFPIYASYRVQQTASGLGISDELPIVAMTEEVKSVVNDFARKEATSHMNTIKTDIENALAVIRTKTSDTQEFKTLFEQAFSDIQKRRAMTLANTAAARIFNISQYEADLQFLTRAGLLEKAYKQLFSLTGDPCDICSYLIHESNISPIPFTQAFADLGETIESGTVKMTFNYEAITSGNVHPNCHCAYRLIVDDNIV